jgi:hypothetical protein
VRFSQRDRSREHESWHGAIDMAERKLKGKDPGECVQKKAKTLIFGAPGVGKTWTSLDFARVYYIDVEGGASRDHYRKKLQDSGAAYFGPRDGSQDFDSVNEEVITLATTKHDYKTLVFDSFSKLFNTACGEEEERLLTANKKVEFGIEKKAAIRHTRRLVRWLDRIDMNVIIICHEKPLWKDGEQIGVTYDGWDKLEYELDLTLNITRRGENRVATVRKSRLIEFPERTTFPWSYQEFASRYGKDIIESDSRAITLATADQVTTLRQLIKVVRVDQDTIDKWFNKAGVETFEEMDTATIAKCIEFLTKQVPQTAVA